MLILLIKCFIMIIWYQNGVKIMLHLSTDLFGYWSSCTINKKGLYHIKYERYIT